MNLDVRMKMISSLRPVKYTFATPVTTDKDSYSSSLKGIFEILRPDVYVINTDAKDIDKRMIILDDLKSKNIDIELKILERWAPPEFDNISTTEIIRKIKRGK